MLKNVLKYVMIALLLVCIVSVSLFGFKFADYDSAGIFDKDAILSNRQFANGTSVYLKVSEDSDAEINSESLQKCADIIVARFISRDYRDVVAVVEENKIRVDVAQTMDIDSLIAQIAQPGDWFFTGSSWSDHLCDSSMIEDATVKSTLSSGYQVSLKFTEEGAKSFSEKTKSYANSSSYIYLLLDGSYTAMATVPKNVDDTFAFGSYDYNTASILATMMKEGALPYVLEIDGTEALAPTLPSALIVAIYLVCIALVVIAALVLIFKGRTAGIFGAMTLISVFAVQLFCLANRMFMLNIATVITFVVCLILSFIFLYRPISALGSAQKNGKGIGTGDFAAFKRYSLKGILIHGILFAIVGALWMLVRGGAISIVMLALVSTVAHFASYFAFTYFGVKTLSDNQ